MIIFVALVSVEVVVDANSLWMFFCEVVKENISLGWLQPYSFLAWNEMKKLETDEEKLFKNNQQCLEEVYIDTRLSSSFIHQTEQSWIWHLLNKNQSFQSNCSLISGISQETHYTLKWKYFQSAGILSLLPHSLI